MEMRWTLDLPELTKFVFLLLSENRLILIGDDLINTTFLIWTQKIPSTHIGVCVLCFNMRSDVSSVSKVCLSDNVKCAFSDNNLITFVYIGASPIVRVRLSLLSFFYCRRWGGKWELQGA